MTLRAGRALVLEALDLRKTALGEEHTQFAASLRGLASIYRRRDSNATSEVMLRRVHSIRETAFGPEHPSVATVLELLAHLYWKRGAHEQADPLGERTLAIRKKAFAFVISEKRLREESLGFSESRLAEFLYRLHALARAYPEDARCGTWHSVPCSCSRAALSSWLTARRRGRLGTSSSGGACGECQ